MRTLIVRKASPPCPPRHDSSAPTAFAASRTSTSRPSWRCASASPPRTSSATTPGRAGRRPKAVVGRDPRASGEFLSAAVIAGLASAGVDVYHAERAAHAGDRVPHRRHPRRLRRDALGVAQRDARQRHQVLRRGRAQARRPDRGRHRGRGSTRTGSAPPVPTSGGSSPCRDGHTRYISHLLDRAAQPARRAQGRHRRRPRRGQLGLTRGVPPRRRRGPSRSAPSPTASTSTTATAPPTSTTSRPRSCARGADLGIAHDGDADRCLAVDASRHRGRRRPDHGDPRRVA